MKAKEKHWESGPNQHHLDDRVKEQMERASKETERRKENLDDKGAGSYKEKNGNEDKQYEGLKSEPKIENQPTHPQTEE
ncbi:hypothetical protein EIM50_17775 [Pseudoxanthomonas sp. SGD-10]|nr:hypothetical protein EIM50_17775 [Pseudoxanthomonas sp. SGD-10]